VSASFTPRIKRLKCGGKGKRWGGSLRSGTHLPIVVDHKSADELPVFVAGHFEIALELEKEELGGT
jgi:hypothetical protein